MCACDNIYSHVCVHICACVCVSGPPGTGKTTVAKRMGNVMKNAGVLPTNDVRSFLCVCVSELLCIAFSAIFGEQKSFVSEFLCSYRYCLLYLSDIFGHSPFIYMALCLFFF